MRTNKQKPSLIRFSVDFSFDLSFSQKVSSVLSLFFVALLAFLVAWFAFSSSQKITDNYEQLNYQREVEVEEFLSL